MEQQNIFSGDSENYFQADIVKELRHFTLDFSITSSPGKVAIIAGPSGSGKTTILRCIAGFVSPDTASIRLGEKVLTHTGRGVNLKPQFRKTGLLSQDYNLFPHMTVMENVRFASRGGTGPEELLDSCGILHLADQKPSGISGGERQRCAVCRVLAMEPDLLLLDEPFSALDPENRIILQQLIRKISRERNIPVIHVTHDLVSASSYADTLWAVNLGKRDDQWIDRQMKFINREIPV